ncbi:hypothetical protein DPMN_116114 [Dreissena polymorpha]|uniref:Uncharacterized protein n=1 Tax=Dreissena polymorpha TaxID=45954 RepID=A0A9D4KMH2_DREPO|nr:hypothetical protein DPMN_116114 [Dreissena polymorpha]
MSEGARAMRTCSYEDFAGMDACTFIRGNMDAYNDMLGTEEISRLISMGSPRYVCDSGTNIRKDILISIRIKK